MFHFIKEILIKICYGPVRLHNWFTWFSLGRNFYDTFRKNTHAETREINETLEKIITYTKPDSITDVIDILNKFHENIKFSYEVEHDGKASFLDVVLMKNNWKLETTVFCKETNNEIYLHFSYYMDERYIKDINWASIYSVFE